MKEYLGFIYASNTKFEWLQYLFGMSFCGLRFPSENQGFTAMTLNLTHLENFIQIVEWGNISKAADYLNIAQPALSRQIQTLEKSLNAKLLIRHKWGVEPTENGKLFLDHARRIQKECLSAQDSVRLNNENPTGSVFVGVPSAYSVALVPPLMQRMRDRFPNVQVHIVEGFSRAIFEWLQDGRLDLAILYHAREHDVAGSQPFLVEEMRALCAPHLLDQVMGFDHATLADRQVIAPWQPHFLRQTLDVRFLDLGQTFNPLLQIDSMRCMIEMAVRGEGVVILPPSCVARELADGHLVSCPIDPIFNLTTVIGHKPGRQPRRATSILGETLYELATELAVDHGWTMLATPPEI